MTDMKYHLLSAHGKSKKAKDFSKKIAECLMILSLIRSHPNIRTQELADKLEIPTRTIQRYISALQAAGEWIAYDTHKRGWRLQYGISVLFGNHLKDDRTRRQTAVIIVYTAKYHMEVIHNERSCNFLLSGRIKKTF